MQLPEPRGPLTAALTADLLAGSVSPDTVDLAARIAQATADPLHDEDLQLALAVCYELHYRGFDGVDDALEWDPALLTLRAHLESRHTAALRELTGSPAPTDEPVDVQLGALIGADDGPSLSRYMSRHGTAEQWREYLTLRSVYHLKEGDPHTFAIPRLSGRAKAAMVEIQADEYGGGAPGRMHSELFAGMMRDLGLDAVHEQIAAVDMCGSLVAEDPALTADVLFGAACSLALDGLAARWLLGAWEAGRSSLRGARPLAA
jgi:hypothetical protein